MAGIDTNAARSQTHFGEWFGKAAQRLVRPFPRNVVRTVMLGPSGVGKTSMLSSVHRELDRVTTDLDVEVTPDAVAATLLSEKESELQELFSLRDTLELNHADGGIAPSANKYELTFTVGRRGKKPAFELKFVDFPGEWMRGAAPAQQAWLDDTVRLSHAIMLPIDTPALLSRRGAFNERVNGAMLTTQTIRRAFQGLTEPRLVVLVPMRCEFVAGRPEKMDVVVEAVKATYEPLLATLRSEQLARLVTVAITPIQTVGGAKFLNSGESGWRPRYVKRDFGSVFAPVDTEQPIRHLFDFLVKLHTANRSTGIFGSVQGLLAGDKALREAAVKVAGGIKDQTYRPGQTGRYEGFTVVQETKWRGIRAGR